MPEPCGVYSKNFYHQFKIDDIKELAEFFFIKFGGGKLLAYREIVAVTGFNPSLHVFMQSIN